MKARAKSAAAMGSAKELAERVRAVDWERVVTRQIPVDESLPPLPVIAPLNESTKPKPALEQKPSGSEVAVENVQAESAEAPATSETSAVATTTQETPTLAVGSKVLTTTLICLAAAIAGIAVLSVFLVKS